ncbi:MAG: thiamine biosynthesis protein ApbE [Sideroxydans sp. GWF2_59_14]|nr:MAG: thiamine biosynthesis protein ApbE [Sideroxydans sp. GWF2_59_14]HAF45824.1 thiamine biosynthesis protein ApbE [Gallionellaceae bacterium]
MSLARLLLLTLALLLSACGKELFYQEQAYVFGTQVDVSIYGEDEAKARQATVAVMHEFQRLHDTLHAWKPSELSSLNTAIAQGKSMQVSPELAEMLKDATLVSAQSEGLFNPAIGGLIQTWGFQADDFKAVLPDAKKVAALVKAKPQMSDISILSHIAWKTASSRNRIVKLDLGGYAKGYALDRAVTILKEQGIHNALINIGGNVMALGTHGTRPWMVGIQHPRKPGPLAILELRDGEAIGTSGDYQRYFELDGKRYCHLIDPRSGYPVQDVQAVTILVRGEHAGLRSDSNSKPLFIAGAAGWTNAALRMQIEEALLVDGEGVVHLTAAMQKRLKFTNESTRREVAP